MFFVENEMIQDFDKIDLTSKLFMAVGRHRPSLITRPSLISLSFRFVVYLVSTLGGLLASINMDKGGNTGP